MHLNLLRNFLNILVLEGEFEMNRELDQSSSCKEIEEQDSKHRPLNVTESQSKLKKEIKAPQGEDRNISDTGGIISLEMSEQEILRTACQSGKEALKYLKDIKDKTRSLVAPYRDDGRMAISHTYNSMRNLAEDIKKEFRTVSNYIKLAKGEITAEGDLKQNVQAMTGNINQLYYQQRIYKILTTMNEKRNSYTEIIDKLQAHRTEVEDIKSSVDAIQSSPQRKNLAKPGTLHFMQCWRKQVFLSKETNLSNKLAKADSAGISTCLEKIIKMINKKKAEIENNIQEVDDFLGVPVPPTLGEPSRENQT